MLANVQGSHLRKPRRIPWTVSVGPKFVKYHDVAQESFGKLGGARDEEQCPSAGGRSNFTRARRRRNLVRNRPNMARCRPILSQRRASLDRIRPSPAQHGPNLHQLRAKLGDLRRARPSLVRFGPDLKAIRPALSHFSPLPAMFCQLFARICRIRPISANFDQPRPNLGRTYPWRLHRKEAGVVGRGGLRWRQLRAEPLDIGARRIGELGRRHALSEAGAALSLCSLHLKTPKR